MKIGTITFHYANNYGAVLQSYALAKYLTGTGNEAKIIDYRTKYLNGTRKIFKKPNSIKNTLLNLAIIKKYNMLKKKSARFDEFIKNNLPLTSKYENYNELKAINPEFDAYVCGSDQVWNHGITFDPAYFLDFVDSEAKIAYAPSFGGNEIAGEYSDKIREYLLQINYLSVREEIGARIIKNLTNRECNVVVDPVFLIGRTSWENLIESQKPDLPKLPSKYILCYFLEKNPLNQMVIEKIKKYTNYKVVSIMTSFVNQVKSDYIIQDAGPIEFLSLFRNAAYVCTSSFHGTAFSIIFNKQFYTIAHSKTNSRIQSLLGKLGVPERIINFQNINKGIGHPINYNVVNKKLENEVKKSSSFIENSLADIKKHMERELNKI